MGMRWGANLALGLSILLGGVWGLRGAGEEAASVPAAPGAAADGVTLVSLQIKNGTAGEIFTAIAKQTGVKFTTIPATLFDQTAMQKPISLTLEKQPFWEALRQAGAATGVFPARQFTAGLLLTTTDSVWGRRPVCPAGPLTAVVDTLGHTKVLTLYDPQSSSDHMYVEVSLFLDPKIGPGGDGVSWNFRLKEAADENGLSLLPLPGQRWGGAGWAFLGSGEALLTTGKVLLHRPAKAGAKIKTFKGIEEVRYGKKFEVWEIADVLAAKPASKTVGQTTYTFQKITTIAGGAEVDLALRMDGVPNEEAMFRLPRRAWVRLLDTNGQEWKSWGWSLPSPARPRGAEKPDDEHVLRFKFMAEGARGTPAMLTLRLPAEYGMLAVPIEFKDLPLP